MRGIYDGSTTGQRSMLSRVLNPFSKRRPTDDAQAQEKVAVAAPATDGRPLSDKEEQDKVMDDFVRSIPGGLNVDGTAKKLKMKPGSEVFMHLMARQNAPVDHRPSAPKLAKPTSPPSQI